MRIGGGMVQTEMAPTVAVKAEKVETVAVKVAKVVKAARGKDFRVIVGGAISGDIRRSTVGTRINTWMKLGRRVKERTAARVVKRRVVKVVGGMTVVKVDGAMARVMAKALVRDLESRRRTVGWTTNLVDMMVAALDLDFV